MPAARKSLHIAAIDGSAVKHRDRYAARQQLASASRPLGDPSRHMTITERSCWFMYLQEIDGLVEAHRSRMEVVRRLRSRLIEGAAMQSSELSLLFRTSRELAESAADTPPREDGDDGL